MELWGCWSVEFGAGVFDSVGKIVRMQSLVDRPIYRIGRAAKPNIFAEDTIVRRARHDLTRLASHDHTPTAFSLFSDWRL